MYCICFVFYSHVLNDLLPPVCSCVKIGKKGVLVLLERSYIFRFIAVCLCAMVLWFSLCLTLVLGPIMCFAVITHIPMKWVYMATA